MKKKEMVTEEKQTSWR